MDKLMTLARSAKRSVLNWQDEVRQINKRLEQPLPNAEVAAIIARVAVDAYHEPVNGKGHDQGASYIDGLGACLKRHGTWYIEIEYSADGFGPLRSANVYRARVRGAEGTSLDVSTMAEAQGPTLAVALESLSAKVEKSDQNAE